MTTRIKAAQPEGAATATRQARLATLRNRGGQRTPQETAEIIDLLTAEVEALRRIVLQRG